MEITLQFKSLANVDSQDMKKKNEKQEILRTANMRHLGEDSSSVSAVGFNVQTKSSEWHGVTITILKSKFYWAFIFKETQKAARKNLNRRNFKHHLDLKGKISALIVEIRIRAFPLVVRLS